MSAVRGASRPGGLAPVIRRIGVVNSRLTALLLLLVLVFGVVLGNALFNGASIRSMAYQLPELGILSLAMMVPLLSGGLDLSIISTANLVALTVAFLFHALVPHQPGVLWIVMQLVAILAGLALACVIGLVNGLIIARLEVSPILTTLGAMTLVKGISIGLTHGNVVTGFPATMVFIGNGAIAGVPLVMLIFIAVAAVMSVILNHTSFGHLVTMVGSNEEATRYSGVHTKRTLVKVYIASSLLAGIGGLIMMARFNSANAAYGESYLLITILAAVLGGISPSGGFGKVTGLVIALVILQLISTAFNLMNFSQFLTLTIWGGTLIAVAGLGRIRERLRFLQRFN
ncbi:ABC transporter permease [Lichenicoccus roseus]|uniref:ABC transporter permease n=1 Tax=Lichenicoccus roseus TaxID=2683649 RepID=A0A5R9J348_9PROT|nr:ABC transporter permease [Lichenicoccus roseus]TLU71399.1 ABC transporter permease [Lichenicoccus roseus]